MEEINQKVSKFYNSLINPSIKNHRYLSWEHCYSFFKQLREKEKFGEEEIDRASLHLAFYLASWGMYRGSSFILQKDYKTFKPIVEEIFKEKYNPLWDLRNNCIEKEQLVRLFGELYNAIEKNLKIAKEDIKNHQDLPIEKRDSYNLNRISEILTTKIILGTIGCIPAYDRFFKKGLGLKSEIQNFMAEKSFRQIFNFYESHKKDIDSFSNKLYPPMKIIDMYFWQIGWDASENKED